MEKDCEWADVVVLGPGLGQEDWGEYLVEMVLSSACTPVIVDADGLNIIAANPHMTGYFTENIMITPHLGEMARLTGETIQEIREDLFLRTDSDGPGVCVPVWDYLRAERRGDGGGP